MEVLRRGLGDEKYAPCPLLVEHVAGRPPRPQVGRGLLPLLSAAPRLRAARVGATAAKTSSSARVRAVKSAAPFTSSTIQPPSAVGSRSTPTRSPPSASAAARASARPRAAARPARAARRARRSSATRPAAAMARDGADDAAAGDEQAQVVAARRHELLHDAARRVEPRRGRVPVLDRVARVRRACRSGRRRGPSVPKRGLSTTGGSSSGTGSHGATCTVGGCGHAGGGERHARSRACRAPARGSGRRSARSRRARSSVSSAHQPASMPSSDGSTSSRPSATSPRREPRDRLRRA